MTRSLICILLIVSSPLPLFAQSITDTTFLTTSLLEAKKVHSKGIVAESNLYSGSNFIDYKSLQDEHPYLDSDDWILGTVQYNNEFYDNVYLQYDIQNDVVIIENYNYGARIQLVSQNIQFFTLNSRVFRQVLDKNLQRGFYEVLYDGKTKVYAKREKVLIESISSNTLYHEFNEKTRYFIYKQGVYYPVKNKRSVLKVFPDQKKNLNQQFQRIYGDYGSNRELGIIRLCELYDSIKK